MEILKFLNENSIIGGGQIAQVSLSLLSLFTPFCPPPQLEVKN